jgi:hypothetical protein
MRISLLIGASLLAGSPTNAVEVLDEQVAAVLITRCLECHQGSEPSGNLSLETRDGLLRGGDSGAAVIPGDADGSLLLQRIHVEEMPPPVKGISQVLPAAERQILTNWISNGAHWPKDRTLDLYEVTTEVRGGRDWWAFQPVQRPTVPSVRNTDRVRNPIDAFILKRLEEQQLQPAPEASTETLIRRLYLDVIGLPPNYEEIGLWSERLAKAEDRSKPTELLVDELLNSPHFGERWARYWLDLVRYAESSGYERDQPKAFAWKYRDWVVDAINADLPCDQFILHQLAGDEIDKTSEQSVIATGFLRLGTWNDEPNDPADYQYERLEDMVHATTTSFLGLTVKCARCHDHKFDPIPQHDYYRIASAFWPGPVSARDNKYLGGPTPEELGITDVLGWTDITPSPAPLHILKNGERHQPMEAAVPGPLSFAPDLFAPFEPPNKGDTTSQRRLQLAEWIIRKDNPLTARVLVNRIWQHHFGEGLVRSPNNFGFKGELPTHPQLLDWLATELMDHNWSAKHIHRLILNSSTWQQASIHPDAARHAEIDSSNRFWWRANRRRLDAEALRDRLLSASGELDLSRIGGEGFKPTFSKESLEGLSRKGSDRQPASPEEQRRRSLYVYVSRSLMPPMMTTFDQCDTTLPCGQRDVTTTPTQALAMLNNSFVHDRSEALADRITQQTEAVDEQIEAAWQSVLGRNPNAGERQLAKEHLQLQQMRFNSTTHNQKEPQSVPSRIPNPVLHLSAGSGVTKDESGRVTTWLSATGQHHASQTNALSQPVLVPEAINGHPAVRFDGNQRFLHVEGELLSSDQFTIVAVASDAASKPGLREIISNWNREENVGTSVFVGFRDTNTIRFSDNFNSAGTVRDATKHFLLTVQNSSEGAFVWQSRSLIASRSRALENRRLGTNWVIGQQGNINGEYWHGDIAELFVFDGPLSSEELNTLWNQLMAKYDLPELTDAGSQIARNTSPAHRSLTSLCHVLLNSNEFLYVD